MTPNDNTDPLHGVTLEMMLTHLVKYYDWPALSKRIEIRCFYNDPSIKSSLKFLRRTPWARDKVQTLYLESLITKSDKIATANPWNRKPNTK